MGVDSMTQTSNTAVLVFSSAALYVLYNIGLVIYNLYFHPLAKFPGPASRAGIHAVDYWHLFKGSHPRNIKELHDKYGPVVRIRPDTLTFNAAAAWKDIYGSRPGRGQLQKDPRFYTVGSDTRNDIVYSNDADHARMRKLLSHAFSDAALREQEHTITRYFDLLVQRLKENIDGPTAGKVDLVKWYNFLTFDIIGDMSFGESFNALETGEYHTWMKRLFEGIKYARFMMIATFYEPVMTILRGLMKLSPAIASAREEHKMFARLQTEKRLDCMTERKDFMSYILRHNDERGMTRNELIATSGLLIVGGSETTATLLSGVTYYLLKTPDAYAKVRREVRGAFNEAGEITLASTGRLPYLHACIEEALRLYPPVPIAMPRLTRPEGNTIDGVFVPGNTSVAVAQLATYHSAKNFHEPETFAPERWLPDPPAEYRNDVREALNPFSYGPRNCIGKNLAYNEMHSVMARMIWHFDMQLCDESKNWKEQDIFIMWEKPALYVKLSHRSFG